jgi:hypothetical protein
MVERRSLTEGLKSLPAPVDPQLEKAFVYGNKGANDSQQKHSAAAAQNLSRVPISTRVRADFAAALKRASLERQLNAVEPNTLQDILEEAIEPWLKSNGYIR